MEYELGELLPYEQPTNYIVESTDYDDSYKTPVLTAGKSFIIGYTNETKGIYTKLPVIIFDDFTTSSQYVDFPFKVKSSAMKILSANSEIADLKYLFYKMQTIQFDSANHKRYWISEYSKIKLDLPTLAEQERIVKRIETMFAKLDQAQEKSQAVLDNFETRKAAILHKAFSGELTANWRKENDIKTCEIEDILNKTFAVRDTLIANKTIQKAKISTEFDERFVSYLCPDWKIVKLGSIAFVTKLAGFEYTKYIKLEETGEIPAIRAQNVRKGYLDETNLLYISKEVSEFLQRSSLTKKSVLVTFIGAGIGDVCVFDKPTRYHLAPNVAKIEPFNSENEEYVNVKYIMYYLISNFGQHEIFKNMKATAQPSLSMETIRDIEIPIPSLLEQKEIVRILDTVLEKESRAKEAAQTVLDQIALLKKSILARAFRGEL